MPGTSTVNPTDPLKVKVEDIIKENARETASKVPVEDFVVLKPKEEPPTRPKWWEIRLSKS